MKVKIPEYSKLEEPHKVEGAPVEQKNNFYEMARSRTRIVDEEKHARFEQDVFGFPQYLESAIYVVSNKRVVTEGTDEYFVDGLDISINRDFFFLEGEDYTDLIPYAIEHEIYEAWLWAKRGYQPGNSKMRHLLARIKQVEIAFKDGKAERLLEFYKKAVNNDKVAAEFDLAYRKVLKRNKIS